MLEYLSWLQDIESNPFISSARSNYSLVELQEYVKSKNSKKDVVFLGIFHRKNQMLIGTIKLEPISVEKNEAWLGIMIGNPNSRGQGFGYEAIQALLAFAKNVLKVNRFFLGVDPLNYRACKLYLSLGFTPVGVGNIMSLII